MHLPIAALLNGEMLSEQEMGDVGDEGDVVDEQLWGQDEDKPQQSKAEEKYEKDAPVQVIVQHLLAWMGILLKVLVTTAKSTPRMGVSKCNAAHCDRRWKTAASLSTKLAKKRKQGTPKTSQNQRLRNRRSSRNRMLTGTMTKGMRVKRKGE